MAELIKFKSKNAREDAYRLHCIAFNKLRELHHNQVRNGRFLEWDDPKFVTMRDDFDRTMDAWLDAAK